ncbi:hypothetical protein NDU88_000955 [Pleurodeles waltl]|uniref:Uncharacterized protein n=1 Tax=Pleurodeles waltl TaxID=8319 RepID=A0AAV7VAC6_PLEWA|nr:hypothetical protein NDU88_000955 [Pleurodeles waltl]
MEPLTQSPRGLTRSSSPGSHYDVRVVGTEGEGAREDVRDDAGERRAEPRRVDSGEKEKMWSRKSEGNEDERSQDSRDNARIGGVRRAWTERS